MSYNFSEVITVGGRRLGTGSPALIVAEIGGNHGGQAALAEIMVDAAAQSGAGAIKFQAYQTHKFLSPSSPYYSDLAREELPFDTIAALARRARRYGLAVGLTVFDREGLDFAVRSGVDFLKIASGDVTNYPLLHLVARAGVPIFLSTGASLDSEVREALEFLAPARDLVLMQCTSLYPAPLESVNLAVLKTWQSEGLLTGFSDHTLGLEASYMAATLGAVVLEKHFTTNRQLPGGDNAISMQPRELKKLSSWIDLYPRILGRTEKVPYSMEWSVRPLIRRVLVATRNLKAGHRLAENDLDFMRPPPISPADILGLDRYKEVLNRTLRAPVAKGEPLTLADLDDC